MIGHVHGAGKTGRRLRLAWAARSFDKAGLLWCQCQIWREAKSVHVVARARGSDSESDCVRCPEKGSSASLRCMGDDKHRPYYNKPQNTVGANLCSTAFVPPPVYRHKMEPSRVSRPVDCPSTLRPGGHVSGCQPRARHAPQPHSRRPEYPGLSPCPSPSASGDCEGGFSPRRTVSALSALGS